MPDLDGRRCKWLNGHTPNRAVFGKSGCVTFDRPPVPLVRLDGAEMPVLDALHDAVIVADEDNVIRYANDATASLLGWRRDDLIGRPVTTIVPERFRQMHLAGFAPDSRCPVPTFITASRRCRRA